MDCVNHSGVTAAAYCQNCGKALCGACVRNAPGGQVLCETCWTAWQSVPNPFIAPPPSGPNPTLAGVLGLIPGVGAMYNAQYFKGLIHVVVFVVIISITTHYGLFGLLIPAWVLYQAFEAFHTAKAIREGQPLPDPLGLNEVGNWLNLGGRPHPGQPSPGRMPGAGPAGAGQSTGGFTPPATGAYQPPPSNPYQAPYAGGAPQPPYTGPYQNPYGGPYGGSYGGPYGSPYGGAPPAAGFTQPGVPPVAPPPTHWRRKEPIGAIVLIGLGLLFLLGQWDLLSGRVFEFTWPVLLIGLGAWLVVRRLQDTPVDTPVDTPINSRPNPPGESHEDAQGGSN